MLIKEKECSIYTGGILLAHYGWAFISIGETVRANCIVPDECLATAYDNKGYEITRNLTHTAHSLG